MSEDNIHHSGSLRANLTPATSTRMPESDAMILQLDKLLIQLQQLLGLQRSPRKQILLRVGKNLLAMTQGGWGKGFRTHGNNLVTLLDPWRNCAQNLASRRHLSGLSFIKPLANHKFTLDLLDFG